MPFINGQSYMNPAYGHAIENARANESTDKDQGGHWVTIDGSDRRGDATAESNRRYAGREITDTRVSDHRAGTPNRAKFTAGEKFSYRDRSATQNQALR